MAIKDELIIKLLEQLKLYRHSRFGKQSEIGENVLDNDDTNKINLNDDATEAISGYNRRKPKRKGRLIDSKKLPRFSLIHDLALENRNCAHCGNALKHLDPELSEKLEIFPELVYCIEHIRHKYTCNNCKLIFMAPKPRAPIPKASAGASLITEVIIKKILYHLPCYRQAKILANYGLIVPDNIIGNWIMDGAVALSPLCDALWQEVTISKYLQVDETPVKLLKPEKNAYIWTYYNPILRFVVYDFALTRSGKNAQMRLKDFNGKLQTDGYPGYDNLHNRSDTAFGCNAHARRKFADVLKITNNKTGIAANAVLQIQELYAVETDARDKHLDFTARKQLRQIIANPIWDKYIAWLHEQVKLAHPKSKIGAAIQYTLNRTARLTAYLEHGEIEIDTNGVENLIRPVCLGKKNWLFFGNEESAQNYMLLYSLVQSCILQEINPRIYIHYVLTKVHELRRGEIATRSLLPHVIEKKILENFAIEQEEERKRVLSRLKYPDTS